MEAKELRIGNYVQDEDGHIVQMELIYFSVIFKCRLSEDDIYPIPLTEEWLLKFGFENIDTNENGGDNYWYLSKGDFMLDRSFQSLQMNTGFDLSHVHQLQNLYFALTGEELTIKQ